MKSNKSNSHKKNETGKRKFFGRIAIVMVIFSIIASGFIVLQIKAYNDSVLDIYANQQDAYVQLVLDQINIQGENTDEEMIGNILGSLDSSGDKYWTLSKEQSLLFVKDVSETNRYKGFTTATYYVSDSAKKFLKKLELNKVIHQNVKMNDVTYVASGVLFDYNGNQYKICLLTNEEWILDNNNFLQAEITIIIGVAILLLLLLIVSMSMAEMLDKREKNISELNNRIETQNINISALENKLEMNAEYEPRHTVFKENVIDVFMQKLQEKDLMSVTFAGFSFDKTVDLEKFVMMLQWMLDNKVLRFYCGDKGVLLVFINHNHSEVRHVIEMLDYSKGKMIDTVEWHKTDGELTQRCHEYIKKVKENGGDKTL